MANCLPTPSPSPRQRPGPRPMPSDRSGTRRMPAPAPASGASAHRRSSEPGSTTGSSPRSTTARCRRASLTPAPASTKKATPKATSKTTTAPAPAPTTTAPAPAKPSGTFVGSTQQTRFGPVQVQITLSNGKITAAKALQYPNNDFRSQQISQQAIPYLVQETLAAQSANIQGVGGASYTSQGWYDSLLSALAKAGL